MVHLAQFPALPQTPDGFNWNPDVLRAHMILSTAYNRAATLLCQEEADPMRLRIHSEQIAQKMLRILEALVPEIGDQAWIESAATAFGQLTVALEQAATIVTGVENSKIKGVVPIRVETSGRRGRPRKAVNPVWLADAFSEHRRLTLQTIADALGMHRNTLRNYLKRYNVYRRFSTISDADLDIDTPADRPGASKTLNYECCAEEEGRRNVGECFKQQPTPWQVTKRQWSG
ncbi:hypothetical protein C8R45DRAFT_1112712 [Mycena sanguinolenta]|nr:hypothetical protein C8R45DRAFT_1112712 [Mycena sanguinolenta]